MALHSDAAVSAAEAERRPRFVRLRHLLEWSIGSGLAAGAALHLTVRDGIWPLSAAYYAAPSGVLALGAVVAVGIARRRKPWVPVAALFITVWFIAAVRITPASEEAPSGEAFTFCLWNTFNETWSTDGVAKLLKEIDADFYAIVEAGLPPDQTYFSAQAWAERLPGRTARWMRRRFVAVSRPAPVTTVSRAPHPPVWRKVDYEINGRPVTVLMVHPESNPLRERGQDLTEAVGMAVEFAKEGPTIITGDFNTPPGSVHFDPLRESFTLASEAGGPLYRPTWPMPVPVLQLDQVWVSRHFHVVDCDHITSMASDHRPVVAKLILRGE